MLQADSWLTEPSGKSSKKLRWILLHKCLINIINDFNEKNSLHSSVSTDLRKGEYWLYFETVSASSWAESLISAVRCQPAPFRCCPAPPRLPLPLRLHVRIPVFSPGPTGPFALFCTSFYPAFPSLCCSLNLLIWKWKSLIHVQLCDPMDYTVRGILQARILEWVAFPFPRGSSQTRNRTGVSCIAGGFFTSWATRDALDLLSLILSNLFFLIFIFPCLVFLVLWAFLYLRWAGAAI